MADITAEQVERAIRCVEHATGEPELVAALTRWHAELVAAETPRKVARWDAEAGLYALSPGHPLDNGSGHIMEAPRANAIAWGYTIEGGPAEDSPERLPARCGDCKHYDGDRLCKASTGQRFTWGSYEPASWCPLRFAAKADDTAPERLKARREALGWSMTDAALVLGGACDERDIGHYEAHDDACCMPLRTRYAAALSAAEAEARRAAQPDPLAYTDSPAWDEPAYSTLRQPAPEVVDVPQPPNPVAKRCGDVLAKHWPGDTIMHIEVDGGGYVRAPVALLRAMLAAIDAQQTAPVQPERPEPRYKVGDWVRAHDAPPWRIARADWWPERHCWRYSTARFGYDEGDLTPALDPALHETARRTVAWLRDPNGFNVALLDYAHRRIALPGYSQWSADHDDGADARWAAQLERLLGDA